MACSQGDYTDFYSSYRLNVNHSILKIVPDKSIRIKKKYDFTSDFELCADIGRVYLVKGLHNEVASE